MLKNRELLFSFAFFILLIFYGKVAFNQDTTTFQKGKVISTVFANYHLLNEGANTITEFQIMRAYLGYEYRFSKELKSTIIMDFGDPKVLENQFKMTGFLKNAYIEYKSDFFTINFGLIPTKQMQFYEQSWSRRYVMKAFQDQQKLGFTADYGLTFEFAPLPNLSFDFGVVNGKGHTDPTHDQNVYRRNLGLTYKPIQNLSTRLYWDITNSDSNFRKTYNWISAFQNKTIGLGVEFVYVENNDFSKNRNIFGTSVFANWKVDNVWSYFIRYDNSSSTVLTGQTLGWNIQNDGQQFLMGVENILAKGVKISPNLRLFLPEQKSNNPVFGFFLNLEAKI